MGRCTPSVSPGLLLPAVCSMTAALLLLLCMRKVSLVLCCSPGSCVPHPAPAGHRQAAGRGLCQHAHVPDAGWAGQLPSGADLRSKLFVKFASPEQLLTAGWAQTYTIWQRDRNLCWGLMSVLTAFALRWIVRAAAVAL